MPKDYTKVPAVVQFDTTACWAASLEWWARAIGNRPIFPQLEPIKMHRDKWDTRDPDHNPEYGKITSGGLIAVIREPRWGWTARSSRAACSTAFTPTRGCAWGLACMDPWGGRFTARPAGYYSRSDRLIIGVAHPVAGRRQP